MIDKIANLGLLLSALTMFGPCSGCKRENWPGIGDPVAPAAVRSEEPLPSAVALPAPRPAGSHPRILLTPERLAAVQHLARTSHPVWTQLQARCQELAGEDIESGYQGWDWGSGVLSEALCWHATKNASFGNAAIKYFNAILDDGEKVGDRKGGDKIVQGDDGYPIRTRGFLGAIAYDWLHEHPSMTPALRKHAADRFHAWLTWYKAKGYKNADPIANYYAGYFGAVALGGIAMEGDDARAADLRTRGRDMWERELVPVFKQKLTGGDWPEGWQYGGLITVVLGTFVDAEGRLSSSPGRTPLDDIPWLKDTVAYHTHALLPDGAHVFDHGDWSEKPATLGAHDMLGVLMALPPGSPLAPKALFIARLKTDVPNEWIWLRALADDPSKKAEDPRKGPTSYLSTGSGTMLARSDWSDAALWVALRSTPYRSDHQHVDQGNFEVVRGSDQLLIDAGGYGAYSTQSHNTIWVDDKKEHQNYPPNQGVWGNDCAITRFEDAGPIVYAEADFGSAYNNDDYPRAHRGRSVTRAERELIFSKAPIAGAGAGSGRVVVYDRVSVSKGTYAVVWAGHAPNPPEVSGPLVRIRSGASQATVTSVLPQGVTATVLKEPTVKTDEVFANNEPPENATSRRFEIAAPKGEKEKRFLHVIAVTAAGANVPAAVRIEGEHADGAALGDEAYIFPSDGPQSEAGALSYRAPVTAVRHVIAGLAKGGSYRVTAIRDGAFCKVSLGAGDRAASAQGLLVLALRDCAIR